MNRIILRAKPSVTFFCKLNIQELFKRIERDPPVFISRRRRILKEEFQ